MKVYRCVKSAWVFVRRFELKAMIKSADMFGLEWEDCN